MLRGDDYYTAILVEGLLDDTLLSGQVKHLLVIAWPLDLGQLHHGLLQVFTAHHSPRTHGIAEELLQIPLPRVTVVTQMTEDIVLVEGLHLVCRHLIGLGLR